MERSAFQFQLIQAAVTELLQIGVIERAQLRMCRNGPVYFHGIPGGQQFGQERIRRRDPRHLTHPPGRLGADHAPLARQQVILQGFQGVVAPGGGQFAQQTIEDHGKEIIYQRRIPAGEQLRLQHAVMGGQFVGTLPIQRRIGRRQRCVETLIETGDARFQAAQVMYQTDQATEQVHTVPPGRHPISSNSPGEDLVRYPLLDPHHLLHEAPVGGEARQQRQQAVPVEQVVVDPAPHHPQHAGKDPFIGRNRSGRHRHDAAELAIDLFVDMAGKGEGQRRGDTTVTFGDVAVVPDIEAAIRIRESRQRCDGPGLQQIERAVLDAPLDILRPAEVAGGPTGKVGHGADLFGGQAGTLCRFR